MCMPFFFFFFFFLRCFCFVFLTTSGDKQLVTLSFLRDIILLIVMIVPVGHRQFLSPKKTSKPCVASHRNGQIGRYSSWLFPYAIIYIFTHSPIKKPLERNKNIMRYGCRKLLYKNNDLIFMHYKNTPMLIYRKFHLQNLKIFR